MKRIRQGNTIHFRYSVYRSSGSLEEEEDLTGIEVTTSLQNRLYGTLVDVPFSVEGNVITGQIPGIPHLRTGVYNFCLSYQKDGTDFAVDTDAFQIVDSSSKTGGENTCPHVEAETVELKGVVEFGVVSSGSIEQVQADWKESNEQSKAFIKNKPDLKTVATSGSYNDLSDKPDIPTQLDVPTKTSQLTNDSSFISDTAYVHTDNNYTTLEKNKLEGIQEGAEANVNADWNATTGDAEILNKPVLSKVATTGSYNDLKDIPVIPGMPDVPTKTSDLENDSNFVSDPNYVHTDNNYSDGEKEKVAGLQNYDDTTLRAALQSEINRATLAEGGLDATVKKVASDLSSFITGSPDADDIINRWQEVTAFLNGITEDKTLSGMLLDLKKQIDESVTAKLSDYYTSVRIDELFVKKLVGSRLITEEEATKLAGLENYDDSAIKTSILANTNAIDAEVTRAKGVETALSTSLGTKVDKVEGKGLSTNDYTTPEKEKLAGLSNYDDTNILTQLSNFTKKIPIMLDLTDWYNQVQEATNKEVYGLPGTQATADLFDRATEVGAVPFIKMANGNTTSYYYNLIKQISTGSDPVRIDYVLNNYIPGLEQTENFQIHVGVNGTEVTIDLSYSYLLNFQQKQDRVFIQNSSIISSAPIYPNMYYKFPLITLNNGGLSVTLLKGSNVDSSGVEYIDEYMFEFKVADDNVPFSVANEDATVPVKWITEPDIKAGKTYQVSIVNNLAVIGGA